MPQSNHFDSNGNARMVDVGGKPITRRVARAAARIRMKKETAELIEAGDMKKGDVQGTAKLAGIMGCKQTPQLIPLCHPIAIDSVNIDFAEASEADGMHRDMEIIASVSSTGPTGVEMEALTAATVAALTVYDMCKSVDREMKIQEIRLLEKSGGKSGHFIRSENGKES